MSAETEEQVSVPQDVVMEKPEAEKPKEVEKSKRSPDVVAPATRSTAPKKVKLTQTQVNIAIRLGVPLELYAKKVAEEMRKE